jgi:hypothetical protein
MFAIGSTPGFDDGALGSFDGSRRVTQCLQWAAARSIVGCVLGGVTRSRLCVVVLDRRSFPLLSPGGARRDGPHRRRARARWPLR